MELLAGTGIYSVLAYRVKRWVREIGVRVALVAGTQQVLRMVVIQGLKRRQSVWESESLRRSYWAAF